MSPRFTGPLRVELTGRQKKGRPIWRVYEPIGFECELDGERRAVSVPSGFETDFASVPRFFWRFAPPGGPYAAAAVIHDWLYVHRIGERYDADRIFLEGMKSAGVGRFQRSIIYRAVRMFGNAGWGS